jgi:hypothetical protein
MANEDNLCQMSIYLIKFNVKIYNSMQCNYLTHNIEVAIESKVDIYEKCLCLCHWRLLC